MNIEYSENGSKSIFLSIDNPAERDVSIRVSRLCYGFGLIFRTKDGPPIFFPTATARAMSPRDDRIWPKNGTLSKSFDLGTVKLPMGNYYVDCFWSSVQSTDLQNAEAAVTGLELSVDEDGAWDLVATANTSIKALLAETIGASRASAQLQKLDIKERPSGDFKVVNTAHRSEVAANASLVTTLDQGFWLKWIIASIVILGLSVIIFIIKKNFNCK